MRRTPSSVDIPDLQPSNRADRLPVEYTDYAERLKDHPYFDEFRSELDFLHEQGYVILPQAVSPDLCDKLAAYYSDVQTLTADELPYVEYFHNHQSFYGVKYSEQVRLDSEGKFKMIDLFSHNALAREACFADKLARFLSLIFASDVLAFQQLGFIYGTEQPIHQDTAYVRVSKPAMLAASWIALEDIRPETGELEFIPRSHNYNAFRFDSRGDKACELVERDPERSLWFNYIDQAAHADFLKTMESLKPLYGCKKFAANKGDALIWISFLAHGGSKISEENALSQATRKSLVTHYCPHPAAFPVYFKDVLHMPALKHKENCYMSSKIYPLTPLPEAFSGPDYLAVNPDIKASRRFSDDPGLHYLDHGRYEGRSLA